MDTVYFVRVDVHIISGAHSRCLWVLTWEGGGEALLILVLDFQRDVDCVFIGSVTLTNRNSFVFVTLTLTGNDPYLTCLQ